MGPVAQPWGQAERRLGVGIGLRSELLARGLAPRSATQYVRVIRKAERWCEENGLDLATVTGPQIMEFVHMQPRGWSTRKMLRSALGHYWAIVGRENPPNGIKLPPQPRMVCRALEPREATVLAAAATMRHDLKGLAVLFGLYLALRREEIARTKWDDFRPDLSELYVIGKKAVSAWVPVHPRLGDRLSRWERTSPYVFPSVKPGRDHVGPSTIWEWSRQVAEEAGLPPVAPHVLRHTALAHANDATKDLRAVQQFARHSDPHITSGYTRVTQDRLMAVVMSLDFIHPARRPHAASRSAWPMEEDQEDDPRPWLSSA